MHERKWGLINNGPTFEALVANILWCLDPKTALLGRRGKDGGQDAISYDGTCVYQAKHHENPSASKTISDALGEVEKIARYKKRGHTNFALWEKVGSWKLYTNVLFNARDNQRWEQEVVPAFKELGIVPECITQRHLDALLTTYPEVDRVFFQNESRVFLTIPEVRELPFLDDTFRNGTKATYLQGREQEAQKIYDFLFDQEKRVLCIYGQGGVGKTKLIIETGEDVASRGEWQVLWANVETMTASTQWLMGIAPEKKTLLLIDEPKDDRVITLLIEQLYAGRMKSWKIVITTRSYNDPILQALGEFKIKKIVEELNLNPLLPQDGKAMCLALIEKGGLNAKSSEWKQVASTELSEKLNNIPIWITLAVDELERKGDLSSLNLEAGALADIYIREMVSSPDPQRARTIHSILRWVALLNTVNREDKVALQLICDEVGLGHQDELLLVLNHLTKKQGIVQWGARNRFVEIKPDVIRDRILTNWFFIEAGFGYQEKRITGEAEQLIAKILDSLLTYGLNESGKKILISLAHVERLLRLSGGEVPLLASFFDRLINDLPRSVSIRVSVVEALLLIAPYYPAEIVRLSRKMRLEELDRESSKTILGENILSTEDVTLELAWLIYSAFPGADSTELYSSLLSELCLLREEEERIMKRQSSKRWLNNGKSASQLISRTFETPRQFTRSFNEAIYRTIESKFQQLKLPNSDEVIALSLKDLVEASTAVERREVDFIGYKFSVQSYTLLAGSLPWEYRQKVVELIKREIANSSLVRADVQIFYWNLFVASHENARRALGTGNGQNQDKVKSALLDDLSWALGHLRTTMPVEQLRAIHGLWNWYLEFSTQADLINAANKLEAVYQQNKVISELTPLLAFDGSSNEIEQKTKLAVSVAKNLASSASVEGVREFFTNAVRFSSEGRTNHIIRTLAQSLGSFAEDEKSVQDYVFESLSNDPGDLNKNISYEIIIGWIRQLRLAGGDVHRVLDVIISHCKEDDDIVSIIFNVYSWGIQAPTIRERDYVYSFEDVFLRKNKFTAFIQVIGWSVTLDFSSYKSMVEKVLSKLSVNDRHEVVTKVIETIYFKIKEECAVLPIDDIKIWLFEMIIHLDDMDPIHQAEWELDEILKKLGKLPLAWLPKAVNIRQSLKSEDGRHIKVLSSQFCLARFTEKVTSDNCLDKIVHTSILEIIDLIKSGNIFSYILPTWIKNIDPDGLLIPSITEEEIRNETDSSILRCLRKIATGYEVNSTSWRKIAIAILSNDHQEIETGSVFFDLTNSGIRSWSSLPGEVPILFIRQVEDAKSLLGNETESKLKPLWEWNLKKAQAELRDMEEEAKEQRDRFMND